MAEKIDGRKTPEFREASRQRARKMMLHPAKRKAASVRMKALNERPDFAKAHSERTRDRMNALYADPVKGAERRAAAKETFTKLHAHPFTKEDKPEWSRKGALAVNSDPKLKKAASDRMRERHKDPAFAAAVAERLKAGRAKLAETQTFRVPKGHENAYRKLRRKIGAESARVEILKIIAEERK